MHARKTIVSLNSTAEIFPTHSKKGTTALVKRDLVPAGSGKDAIPNRAFITLLPIQIMSVLGKGDLYGHLNQRTMRQGDFPNSSVFSSGGGRFFSISRMKLPPSSVRVKSRGKYWHINHSGTWERELLRKESGLDRGWKKAANGDKRPQGSLTPQADLMLLGKPF